MQDYNEFIKSALESGDEKSLEKLIKGDRYLTIIENLNANSSYIREELKKVEDGLEEISIDLNKSFTASNSSEEKHLPNNQDNELDILVSLLKEYTQKKIHNSNVITRLYIFSFGVLIGVALVAYLWLYRSHVYENISVSFDTKFLNDLIAVLLSCTVALWISLFNKLQKSHRNKRIIDRNLEKIIRTTSQAEEHVHSGFGKKLELDVRLTEAENALKNSLL